MVTECTITQGPDHVNPFLSSLMFLERRHRLINTPTPVLDGYVKLVDTMGEEADICHAARVTAQSEGKSWNDDHGLIRYLMRHRHTTPLEMVELKFEVMVAFDTWRQWIRHRTANVNEYSTRYTPAIDVCQKTKPTEWRVQSTSNRQGSKGNIDQTWKLKDAGTVLLDPAEQGHVRLALEYNPEMSVAEYLTRRESQLLDGVRRVYETRLQLGVAKEQARKDLTLSTMTKAIWKIDMHNLLHFLGLRMDSHAQFEIRQYANAIGDIVATLYPVTWEAFKQYRLHAFTMTSLDIATLSALSLMKPHVVAEPAVAASAMWWTEEQFMRAIPQAWKGLKHCRERDECLEKLRKMNLIAVAA